MIGVDTNVLVRYFVEERDADTATQGQRAAARRLIESGQTLFVPKSVVLELEWVLRGYYRFAKDQVAQAFEALLQLPDLEFEDRSVVEQALAGLQKGLDFADALHHASCRRCNVFASFATRSLAGPARSMNLQPRVITPQ